MSIKKLVLFTALLFYKNLCNSQVSLINFPDSFKVSSKYYSPSYKPISKSAMWGVVSIGQPYDSLALWPDTPVYNPNKNLLVEYKNSAQKDLILLVDTGQNLDCYEYIFWLEKEKNYYPGDKVYYIENENKLALEAKTNGQALFKGYPVYIINLSDTAIKMRHKKYQIPLIQEALDIDGLWKPIEALFTLPPKKAVANYYGYSTLKPGEMIVSSTYRYKGEFQTMLRVKILVNGKAYYSRPFQGSINPMQLKNKKTYKFN